MSDEDEGTFSVEGYTETLPSGATVFGGLHNGSTVWTFEMEGVKAHIRLSHDAVFAMVNIHRKLRGGISQWVAVMPEDRSSLEVTE